MYVHTYLLAYICKMCTYLALQSTTLHYNALHYAILHYMPLYCIASQHSTSHMYIQRIIMHECTTHIRTQMHTYLHTYITFRHHIIYHIPACKHKRLHYMSTCINIPAYLHTCMCACVHTDMHYTHTTMHTYIHAQIHACHYIALHFIIVHCIHAIHADMHACILVIHTGMYT